ncbi:hypothetical protein [Rhizobium ruizarguesonis]|nr:hypothetical protein U8Q07_04645 [Rhizobium ruizarguesonis]WSH36277.1 hypothetical protein U8P70_04640 [Rhizobium ruizarguesonis]WSH60395.1 hypothetical protein U8P68_04610 [Rhizobium ruizarguesonis]
MMPKADSGEKHCTRCSRRGASMGSLVTYYWSDIVHVLRGM